MANERITDLTEADVIDVLRSNPGLYAKVVNSDTRIQLMERLYGDPEAKKSMQQHSKRLFPKANIVDVDVPAAAREEAAAAIAEDVKAIKEMRSELETERRTRRHEAFRTRLREHGADASDLDAIEQFMVDNEIGPKSMAVAVNQFYEARDAAEPRATGLSPDMPFEGNDPDDKYMQALLASGPGDDLDRISEPFINEIWQDMYGDKTKTRPGGRR